MNYVPTKLDHLATIVVAGIDARNFLHGQLTSDLHALTTSNVMLAACNSAQGRVQAVLWMIERTEGVVLLLTRALAESVATRLRRYVLRAKVSIEADTLAVGVALPQHIFGAADSKADQNHQQIDDTSYLRLAGHRQLLTVGPQSTPMAPTGNEAVEWRIDHLHSGYPQIYPATQERFVAQMLNLDLLGGISFEKGCYTGQEIIARTHFRGAIKRRMFRFAAECSPPSPGTRLLVDAQHAGDVVDAVETSTGCELLAVVSLAQADAQLALETNPGSVLQSLALPYPIATEGSVTGHE